MFKLSQKERGAVAVFLIIVLVPMITCAALFVEVSRVKLAQSLVSSAGDLALNTVLSRYDFELNEFFGMLASAQTENDVISATEDYFEACLKSQEIDTTYLNKYVNSISGLFKNGSDVVDFLDISIPDGTFSVTPTANGALNNPALIKNQIVDFMKFRSPINLAADLLDAFTDIGNQVDTLPDQTECLDKQQTFYDTEEALLDTAYKAYDKMQAYLKLEISDQYIENMLSNMEGYKNTYALIHRKLVFDLAGTENLPVFNASSVSYSKTNSDYSSSNPANFDKVKEQIDYVANAMSKYLSAKNTLENVKRLFGLNNSVYGTRYYINVVKEFNKNNQYAQFVSKANDLATKVAKLKNAYENYTPAEGEGSKKYKLSVYSGVNTSGEKTLNEHYSSLISQWDSIVTNDFKASNSAYNFFRTKLPSLYSTATKGGSLPKSVTATPDGGINRSTADTHVSTIYTEINGYYTKIKDGEKHVDDAINKLEDLKELVGSYKSDFNNWKTSANKSSLDDNDLAEKSRKDIENREMNPEIMDNITESGVQTLIDRLNNVKSALGEVKSVIESIKYNGKKVVDIKNLSDFEKASGVETKNISIKTSEIDSYSDSTFSFESKQSTLNITNNNHPDFSNVNTPPLYKWMKNYFVENKPKNTKDYDEDEANDVYDNFKGQKDNMGGDEKSESDGLSKNEIKDIANRPSGSDKVSVDKAKKSSDMTELSNFITGLFGNFSQTLSNAGAALRDNLYTLDYIMSMFSYDTFENERRLELWEEKNPTTKITSATDFKTSTAEQWKNTEATFKANKSLTNQMINDANCYSYGNEVEYILYGGSNTANKAAAYGTIFMLRLALDAGPVFAQYFSHQFVLAIANSVAAATLGVVPAPLVQFAICLVLTITEASTDISHIKKGIGVPLLKSKEQLFVTFESDSVSTKESATGNETGIALKEGYLQYSDYITLFLFIALLSSEKADAIYLRTADVIQANMTKRTGNSGYRMSQAQVYFTLSSDAKVSPLILPVPLIDNNLGEIKNSDGYENFSTSKWNTFSYSITRGY